jgi:hypothetical protein
VGWLPTRVDCMIEVEFNILLFRASCLEELGASVVSSKLWSEGRGGSVPLRGVLC